MPLLVTSAFASAYLMAMAAGNLGGRIGWAAISDKIGRRNTFHCYTLGSIPIFGCLPFLINECVTPPTTLEPSVFQVWQQSPSLAAPLPSSQLMRLTCMDRSTWEQSTAGSY